MRTYHNITQDAINHATTENTPNLLDQATENFGTPEEVNRRFKPGTHGHHELADRAWIQYENYHTYITNHPTNHYIPHAQQLTTTIEYLLHEYYQLIATHNPQEQTPTPNHQNQP